MEYGKHASIFPWEKENEGSRAKGIAYGGGRVCDLWMELRLLTRGDTATDTEAGKMGTHCELTEDSN